MENTIKKCILFSLFIAIVAGLFPACSEWTELESLDIKQPGIAEQNPELYAQYLANLRTYKANKHKIIYAWFDNSLKQPFSRAHHITTIPDSVDIISLMHPDQLTQREIEEMETVRNDKGTQIIYTIHYAEIEAKFEAQNTSQTDESVAALEDHTPEQDGLALFISSYMDEALSLVKKYGYDGVSVRYEGLSPEHMDEETLQLHSARQHAFFEKTKIWKQQNENKLLVFEGRPHDVLDKSILQECKYIVLHTSTVLSTSGLSAAIIQAQREGVPNDRFIISVSPYSLDESDTQTGTIIDKTGNSVRAITEAAYWVATPDAAINKSGLGIYNIQNDFYNKELVYKYTREAISIINPSPNH